MQISGLCHGKRKKWTKEYFGISINPNQKLITMDKGWKAY